HLDRLAVLRPHDWTLPARRGRVLAAAERREEAATAYAAAARLAPSPQVLSDWLRAAAADDEAAGRKEVALWNLDPAVALPPEDWTLYAVRALLAHQAGQPERVRSDLDELIRRGADEAATIVKVASVAASAGGWQRAAALLTALARHPNVPTPVRSLQAVAA